MLDTTDMLAAALEHHRAGRHEDADQLYRRALETDPDEPTALYLYGLLNFDWGKPDRAVDLLERVVSLRPDHAEAQVTLANLRHWRGEHALAIAGYQRALALDPHRLDAAVGLTNALRESGDATAAVKAGEAVVSNFPTESAALVALGAARMAAGDVQAGVIAYQAAVEHDPGATIARAGLALAYLEAGQADQAADAALAALALDQTAAGAWFARGAALLALWRIDEAITALDRAATLNPDHAATQLNLGVAHAENDRADAAERYLKMALALDPSLAEAHANLGSVYLRADRKVTAEHHFRQALALDPTMAGPHQNLASLLDEQGRAVEAKRHRDQAYTGRNLLVEPAPGSPLTVLMPTTSASGNVPLGYVMPRGRFSRLRWVVEYEPDEQPRVFPPYDVVFNAIGDPDLAGPTEAPLRRFLNQCRRPVLNPPDKIMRTRRDRLPALLGDIEGVVVPAVVRISEAAIAERGLGPAITQAGLALPLLLRPTGSHGGEGLKLIKTPAALETFAPVSDIYATAFLDYRSADGFFRKYRIIFVDRRPYPYHLAVSRDWMVHYESAGMAEAAPRRVEEERFLEDPRAVLGDSAMAAIATIGQRLDLDYAGVDFSLLQDGRMLVFEANATMLVHGEAADGVFAYKNRAVGAIAAAFEAMLNASADA